MTTFVCLLLRFSWDQSSEGIKYYLETHDRLLFGSHETSPIIWYASTHWRSVVIVKSRVMTGRSQALPWWQGGEGVKTTENKIHWLSWTTINSFNKNITAPPKFHKYLKFHQGYLQQRSAILIKYFKKINRSVETRNNAHTREARLQLILFSEDIGAS